MGRARGSRGAARGRRARGGEGRGGGWGGLRQRRAVLPALQLAPRPLLPADALAPLRGRRTPSPEPLGRPNEEAGAERERSSRTASPGIPHPEVGCPGWGRGDPRHRVRPQSALLMLGPRAWGKDGPGGAADLGSPRKDRGL